MADGPQKGTCVSLKSQVRRLFRACGLEVDYLSRHPRETLAGAVNLPIRTIFDVGANVGQFARFAARKFPNATIHSFEPQPDAFRALAVEANRQSGRILPVNIALGCTTGHARMHAHLDHSPSSSLLEATLLKHQLYPYTQRTTPIDIQLDTLDRYIDGLPETPPNEWLIKLDVQGFENRVLAGASSALTLCRVCILEIAVRSLYKDQANFFDLCSTLYWNGLKYHGNISQISDDKGDIIYFDAIFIRS